jgi:hypothetical protein
MEIPKAPQTLSCTFQTNKAISKGKKKTKTTKKGGFSEWADS